MANYNEDQEARDKRLADRAITAADNFSLYLKTWIQEEIIALLPQIRDLHEGEADALLKAQYEQAMRLLDELDRFEINLVMDLFNAKIDDLRQGVYDDGLDAHQYAQDALSSIERLVRRTLRIRKEVESWTNNKDRAGQHEDDEKVVHLAPPESEGEEEQ